MRLENIKFEDSKKLLDLAESESAFIKSKGDENLSVYEIVSLFKDSPKFAIYNLMKGRKRIGIITSFPNEEDGTVSLGALYIKSKYQNRGFGKIMVGLYINEARKLGYKKIFTKTWGENLSSQNIFESLGFKKLSTDYETRVNGDSTISYDLKL